MVGDGDIGLSIGYEDEEDSLGTTSDEDKYSCYNITSTFRHCALQ